MKNKKTLIILSVVLIIIIIGVSLYFIFNNKSNNNETKEIKIDSNREYLYDIYYDYDNKYNSIYSVNNTEEDDNTCSDTSRSDSIIIRNGKIEDSSLEKHSGCFIDLKVPYININSKDATNVNNEIKELYLNYASKFDNSISEYVNNGKTEYKNSYVLTYNYYRYQDMLSILIVKATKSSSTWTYEYVTYNFDLTNGKLLSYKDTLKKLGYNSDTTLENIHSAIKDEIGDSVDENTLNSAYSAVDKTIDNDEVSFIVNNIGNINVVCNVLQYTGNSNSDSMYAISK